MMYNQLDVFHRAFKAYKQEVDKNEDAKKFIRSIHTANDSKEFIETKRSECIIKTDWIEAIEHSLPFIEEAVKQNRQFILQTGETVLIEKVKRISKTSVEHLAHHSELITHLPEDGGDIMPDKLYVSENVSNYAVYENRFLYALLCLIRDFTDSRYLRIVELWNSFDSELSVEKTVNVGRRSLVYSLKLNEKSVNDRSTSYDKDTIDRLARIKSILQTVNSLLQTSLMKEVSQAPLLKPPITRTNVIRMDPAFSAAAELYDFLFEYQGLGYIQQDVHEKMDGFSGTVGENFAEVAAISSYLTYRYGGKLDEVMEREYEIEQRNIKELLEREEREKLVRLKQDMLAGTVSEKEYISALESRLLSLEEKNKENTDIEAKYEAGVTELEAARDREKILNDDIEILKNKLARLQYSADDFKNMLESKAVEHENALKASEYRHQKAIESINKKMDEKLSKANEATEEMEQKYLFASARLHALREEHGIDINEDDLYSKESFLELEKERLAFKRFFNKQWKKTKKQIRKQIGDSMREELENSQNKKKRTGKDEGEE